MTIQLSRCEKTIANTNSWDLLGLLRKSKGLEKEGTKARIEIQGREEIP